MAAKLTDAFTAPTLMRKVVSKESKSRTIPDRYSLTNRNLEHIRGLTHLPRINHAELAWRGQCYTASATGSIFVALGLLGVLGFPMKTCKELVGLKNPSIWCCNAKYIHVYQ